MRYMNTQIQEVQKTLSRINSKTVCYSQIPERHIIVKLQKDKLLKTAKRSNYHVPSILIKVAKTSLVVQ